MKDNNSPPVNPLGIVPVTKLIAQFSLPAIINTLIIAVYNITDQIFIGDAVGNAATNVTFPVTTFLSAFVLMIGMGSSTNFSLNLGAKNKTDALRYVGNGISLMSICGIIIAALALLFLKPLLILFGATQQVLPLATRTSWKHKCRLHERSKDRGYETRNPKHVTEIVYRTWIQRRQNAGNSSSTNY